MPVNHPSTLIVHEGRIRRADPCRGWMGEVASVLASPSGLTSDGQHVDVDLAEGGDDLRILKLATARVACPAERHGAGVLLRSTPGPALGGLGVRKSYPAEELWL